MLNVTAVKVTTVQELSRSPILSSFDDSVSPAAKQVQCFQIILQPHLIVCSSSRTTSTQTKMSAVTLSGPLTAFQPPTSCFNEIWLNGMSDVVLGNPRDNACKPSGWRTAVQYSPALCPASYTSASGQVTTSGSVTETVIACCPRYAHMISI